MSTQGGHGKSRSEQVMLGEELGWSLFRGSDGLYRTAAQCVCCQPGCSMCKPAAGELPGTSSGRPELAAAMHKVGDSKLPDQHEYSQRTDKPPAV